MPRECPPAFRNARAAAGQERELRADAFLEPAAAEGSGAASGNVRMRTVPAIVSKRNEFTPGGRGPREGCVPPCVPPFALIAANELQEHSWAKTKPTELAGVS
jgi:hypothetical protein